MAVLESHVLALIAKVQAGERTILVADQPFGVHTVYAPDRQVVRDGLHVFAEDDCGNWIAEESDSSEVVFIDHETEERTVLAKSIAEFLERLSAWNGPELDPGRVRSAWIDPEFIKKVRRGDA